MATYIEIIKPPEFGVWLNPTNMFISCGVGNDMLDVYLSSGDIETKEDVHEVGSYAPIIPIPTESEKLARGLLKISTANLAAMAFSGGHSELDVMMVGRTRQQTYPAFTLQLNKPFEIELGFAKYPQFATIQLILRQE